MSYAPLSFARCCIYFNGMLPNDTLIINLHLPINVLSDETVDYGGNLEFILVPCGFDEDVKTLK